MARVFGQYGPGGSRQATRGRQVDTTVVNKSNDRGSTEEQAIIGVTEGEIKDFRIGAGDNRRRLVNVWEEEVYLEPGNFQVDR